IGVSRNRVSIPTSSEEPVTLKIADIYRLLGGVSIPTSSEEPVTPVSGLPTYESCRAFQSPPAPKSR
ncbi:MAG TPA: hypothetical protein VKV18_07125, partial [Chthonomonas sp.]|nr:hypothetical protein [Chthonomonas sp.]